MSKFIFILINFISLLVFISSNLREYKAKIDEKELIYKSSYLIDEDAIIDEGEMKSFSLDEISLLVVGGAKVTIIERNITKIVPKSNLRNLLQEENEEEFKNSNNYKYGLTANIVAIGSGTEINIISSSILVDCPFSDAIVALDGATIRIKNSIIKTKQKYSKGAKFYNSIIEFSEKTLINTIGDFSPCIELNGKDDNFINIFSIILNTTGQESPLINTISKGELNIISGEGTAENSQILVMQGICKVSLHLCTFNSKLKRISNNDNNNLNNAGIVLYQNEENFGGEADLQMYNCKFNTDNIKIEDIIMISCYNVEASITVDNTEFKFENIFMKAEKTENSNIYTKVQVELKQINFKGKIIASEDSEIILKGDKNNIKNALVLEGNVSF